MNALWNELKMAGGMIASWLAPSEQTQWDMAASAMTLDGHTDFDIQLAIGPRP